MEDLYASKVTSDVIVPQKQSRSNIHPSNLLINKRLQSLHPTRIQEKNQGISPSRIGSTTDSKQKNYVQKIKELEEQILKLKDNNLNNSKTPTNTN